MSSRWGEEASQGGRYAGSQTDARHSKAGKEGGSNAGGSEA
jgi:hypothetical protein